MSAVSEAAVKRGEPAAETIANLPPNITVIERGMLHGNAEAVGTPSKKTVLSDEPCKRAGAGYRACKRAFDVVFSAGVCVVLAIPVAVACAAVSLDSPGAPFFRQKRVGKGGKPIYIFKIRSMYQDSHEHPERYLDDSQMTQWKREQKVDYDPRVTRVGRVIRKTSLDELPQFLNVLVGDMSVIGPRPVTLDETYEFGADRDEVLSVRPGITGLWQSTDRNEATWENGHRQRLELEYVRNQGFAMDARCFFGTFGAMFGKNKTGR